MAEAKPNQTVFGPASQVKTANQIYCDQTGEYDDPACKVHPTTIGTKSPETIKNPLKGGA
jgi:hypothetical protein